MAFGRFGGRKRTCAAAAITLAAFVATASDALAADRVVLAEKFTATW